MHTINIEKALEAYRAYQAFIAEVQDHIETLKKPGSAPKASNKELLDYVFKDLKIPDPADPARKRASEVERANRKITGNCLEKIRDDMLEDEGEDMEEDKWLRGTILAIQKAGDLDWGCDQVHEAVIAHWKDAEKNADICHYVMRTMEVAYEVLALATLNGHGDVDWAARKCGCKSHGRRLVDSCIPEERRACDLDS
jgi:hypothetical protein